MSILEKFNATIKETLLEKGGKFVVMMTDEMGWPKILTKVEDNINSDTLLEVIKENLPTPENASEYIVELIHEDKLFEMNIHELEYADFIGYVNFLELYYELTKDRI